ncbi:MAG: glycosyltransferase family 4 protein [Thermoplasmata archaeon]|nr:MAG: glycosyltransferase family 4 protein [Thermoplasmata archaeon]
MRLLKLCVRFPPAPGGVEFQLLKVLKELQKRGHDVQVFTSDLYSEIPWRKLDGSYTDVEGIPVKRFRAHSLKGDYQYSVMPSLVRAVLSGRWDIIHAHSYGFFPSHAGAMGARARRGKFVFTPHFHPGETGWGGEKRKRIRGFYDEYAAGRVISAAEKIICVSEGEKKYAVEAGFPRDRIAIVPDSVDITRFEGLKKGSFREAFGIEGNFVLFVGRLAKNKGLEYLVEAVPEVLEPFPETKFVMIGEDEGMKEKLASRAKGLDVEDKIFFLGALNDEQVSQAFLDSSVFVLPSEFEAFGIVLIEAAAAGRACVATRVGGIPYVVKDGETGTLVDYADSHQLARAISELLGDEKKRSSLGRTGKKHVEENFTIEKVVDRLEGVYDEVLG